jgi:hypothetical protein
LLDAFKVHEIASGCAALALVLILTFMRAEQFLDEHDTSWGPVLEALALWLWTSLLAVLSIIIWRLGFFLIHAYIVPPDQNIHALSAVVVGACVLIAAGRFRSTSSSAPVGIAPDVFMPGERFARAVYSGGKFTPMMLDMVLTVPVMLVWAGVWMFADNLAVPPFLSGVICMTAVALCGILTINESLRSACAALSPVLCTLGDIAWTSFLMLLVIGVWRGIWESLAELRVVGPKHMGADSLVHTASKTHHAALMAMLGAIGLTALQRHRSALFPPVDFSLDEGDFFVAVGSHLPPDKLLPVSETSTYSTA